MVQYLLSLKPNTPQIVCYILTGSLPKLICFQHIRYFKTKKNNCGIILTSENYKKKLFIQKLFCNACLWIFQCQLPSEAILHLRQLSFLSMIQGQHPQQTLIECHPLFGKGSTKSETSVYRMNYPILLASYIVPSPRIVLESLQGILWLFNLVF